MNQADTKRAQAEQAMRISEEQYRLLFEENPLPVWIYDIDTQRFRDVNRTAVRRYGYSREEFLSMTIKDIRPAEDIPNMLESVAKMRTSSDVKGEWRHRKKDGSIIPVAISSHALGVLRPNERLVVAMDLSERKKAEREILERSAQLEAANKELESFSYSVSHDLRAPLRAIDGFSEVLLEENLDKLDSGSQDYLKRIRAASQRMAVLIDDLLALSRVSRTEMHREPVDLTATAESFMSDLRRTEPSRAVDFVAAPALVAQGDARLLTIVLENLLRNAWKFTSKHPRSRIELGVKRDNGQPVYFIRDDGVGFDPQYSPRLFGAFQRLHTEKEFPGTGIGLATVQRIIHRHGGEIWAEGKVNQGATFYFTVA
jgi:PAS domain S-box-containing protein